MSFSSVVSVIAFFYENFGITGSILVFLSGLVVVLILILVLLAIIERVKNRLPEKYGDSVNKKYVRQVGFIYKDLIENWSKEGRRNNPPFYKSPPRAYSAWHSLEQLSAVLALDKNNLYADLKKFLDLFILSSNILSQYSIQTIIKTERELNKKKNEIHMLSQSLTKNLSNL